MLQEYHARKRAGFDVEFITSDPLLSLSCGIKTKQSSVTINPYLFTQELLTLLHTSYPVEIYENTAIMEMAQKKDITIATTQNQFHIEAPYVILANGFDAAPYLPTSDYTLYKTFTIVTSPISSLKEEDLHFTARDTKNPYHYLRFTEDKRVIYGGEDVHFLAKYEKEKALETTAQSKYIKLENSLKKLLKIRTPISTAFAFNGTFATTPDTLPIIDELKNKNHCYCNLGYGANGILYATIGANLLANLIVGKESKDLKLFRIGRN